MIEKDIVYFLNKTRNIYIDWISIIFSNILFIVFLFSLIIFICLYFNEKKFKKLFIAIVIALSLHFLISKIFIKGLLGNIFSLRVRPYLAYPDIIPLGEKFSDSSFPSSHMASVTAFFSVLVCFYKKTKIYFWLLSLSIMFIILMAFSRMHNGMHYPTDIIAGVLLGVGYGIAGVWISGKLVSNKKQDKIKKRKGFK